MSKPTGQAVAAKAVAAANEGISYGEMDCQAFVEAMVMRAGGQMTYAGSNAMARGAAWLGTLANAKAAGKLVPGAGLLIHENDESELPAKYRGDGLGDFSHVGLYVGPNALTDTDKNGRLRACDVVHSGSTMGRVAGSTLANGWTHVIWFPEIDYGADAVPGVELGAGANDALDVREEIAVYAVVTAPSGGTVKLRQKPSSKCSLYWHVNVGETVEVLETGAMWTKIKRHSRVGWMQTQFLQMG